MIEKQEDDVRAKEAAMVPPGKPIIIGYLLTQSHGVAGWGHVPMHTYCVPHP